MMSQFVAEMESSGPQYSKVIKGICILGRRAWRKKKTGYADVVSHIELYMSDELEKTKKSYAPGSKITGIWEADDPGLPERVFRDDPIARSKLPSWAIDELNQDATMSQAPWAEHAGTMTPNPVQQAQQWEVLNSVSPPVNSAATEWGKLILLGGIGFGIVIWDSMTRNRAGEESVRRVERPASRGLHLTGRKNKYMS